MIDEKTRKQNISTCVQHLLHTMSVVDLADSVGVNQSTIYRWRDGEIKTPHPSHLQKLAELAEIKITDLDREHSDFVRLIAKHTPVSSTIVQSLHLASIQKWKHSWSECAERHIGSYYLYSAAITSPGEIAKCL